MKMSPEGPAVLPAAGWHGLSSVLTFASLHRPLAPPPFLYAPTSNAEEAEVEWFYEDLQDFKN